MMPNTFDVFLFVLKYALTSFGGLVTVLPEMERELALRGWLTHAEFASTYALVQVLPGPNSVFCLLVGFKVKGLAGLFAAMLGVLLPPVVLMTGIWQIAKRTAGGRAAQAVGGGLKFVVLALMLTSTWDYLMLQTMRAPGSTPLKLASFGLATAACAIGLNGRVDKKALIGIGALAWALFSV